ncbi:MAG TPA: TetR/AcrR family transcriptional regulator C-terminal domain-containing protein [Streptosporangiaceae bacterium]|nr:TetR/AcrR family transcriptional regulator C-terminal domain-containing protein [Streptosporangiaceae bacterium]
MSTSSPAGRDQGPSTPPSVLAAGSAAASIWAAPPLPAPKRPVRRRSQAGRKATLTTEAIVAAAIEVLDEGGVAGLSMRRVAEHLGTGAASLYAHVSGKEELLELVYDALVGQVPLVEPDPATWRDQLRQIMRDFHDVLVSHTDAALAGLGRIPTSPQTMAAAEVLAGIMRAGGLCPLVVALGLDQLVLYVSATAFEDGLFRRGMDEEEMLRYYAGVHAFYAALPAERYPVLASIAPDMTGHDDTERFSFGLDVLIAGLEAVNARVRDSGQGVGQGEP